MADQKIEYGDGTVTFKCAKCRYTVTEVYDDVLSVAEYEHTHPGEKFDRKDLVLLCEPCYKNIIGATIQ